MSEPGASLQKGGKNMTALGVIALILGFIAMWAPGITGISVALTVGVLMILGGFVRMFWAFTAGTVGRGLLVFAIGLLTLLCGVYLAAHPLFATGVLTLVLAAYFVVDGVFEIAAGLQRRPAPGAGWLVFGGFVSILLGLMIWGQFPLSGAWAIGILFGVKLLFVGMIMITTGSSARALGKSMAD